MKRGAVILIENAELMLIERVRAGKTYYLFPGGGVEPGETVEQAAIREAWEELGLVVVLGPLAAVAEHDGNTQFYYRAHVVGGTFGSGNGPEYSLSVSAEEGRYKPVRLPIHALHRYDIRPRALAEALSANRLFDGCPVLHIVD